MKEVKRNFTLRISPTLLQKLKKLAVRKKITVGEIIRISLAQLLREKE